MRHTYISIMKFQPTLPARGATYLFLPTNVSLIYFNPRSPHGERPFTEDADGSQSNFNPRSPHGERRIGALS